MNKVLIVPITISCLCMTSLPALGAEWRVGGYLESVAIDSDIALREGVEDTAYGLGVEAAYLPTGWLDITMGLGLVMYDDNASFTQTVEQVGLFNNGDITSADSDATGLLYFLEAGPSYSFVEDTLVGFAKVGIAGLDSDRSIPNCSNCYEENIDIDAGSYLQLGMAYQFESWELMFKYNSYLGDDGLDNGLRISIRTR